MGAAHQKDQDMIETWDFQPPPPFCREELEIEWMMDCVYMIKCP